MEKCFVQCTRREISPTFVSLPSPRPNTAVVDLSLEPSGDTCIVRVQTAKLTYPVLSSFFDGVRAILDDGARNLVLDLAAVTYIDSATIGCLMDLYRQANAVGGALKLAGVQKRVETMLTMTGAQNFIEVHPDEPSAVKSFGA